MANQKGETTSIGHFYNRCVDAVNNLFDTMSFWTHSKDVEFVDGKTAETKVGAINGITSDISGEADDIAASIKCVNELNASLVSDIYVGEEDRGVLVDAGISMKRICEGLNGESISPEQIEGILITHEHSDHISGLGPLLRKYEIPVYGTEKTLQSILSSDKMKKVNTDLFFPVLADKPVKIKDMEINTIIMLR